MNFFAMFRVSRVGTVADGQMRVLDPVVLAQVAVGMGAHDRQFLHRRPVHLLDADRDSYRRQFLGDVFASNAGGLVIAQEG